MGHHYFLGPPRQRTFPHPLTEIDGETRGGGPDSLPQVRNRIIQLQYSDQFHQAIPFASMTLSPRRRRAVGGHPLVFSTVLDAAFAPWQVDRWTVPPAGAREGVSQLSQPVHLNRTQDIAQQGKRITQRSQREGPG